MTVADIKAKINKDNPDIPTTHIQLYYSTPTGAGGGVGEKSTLFEDNTRTLVSIAGDEDDIATLKFVIVKPLTLEQIEERSTGGMGKQAI